MVSHTTSRQDWKETRRWRALELKREGWAQRQIAQALGVSEAAVSQWLGDVNEFGEQALHARPRPGAPRRLGQADRQQLPELLSHGAEAYGFRGDIWTCARVAKVIEREFGVAYHKAHVSRLLKQVAWTPQKPIERATQRNEALIESWRTEVWPELKKRPAGNAEGWFSSMNRASICCRPCVAPMPRVARRPCCGSFKHATICR